MDKKFDYDLLLINPPILTREPGFGSVGTVFVADSLKVTAMNPGILSIASYTKSRGIKTKIVDLSVDCDYKKLAKLLEKEKPLVAGVSSQCGFDYLEALKCIEIIKKTSPDTLVIAGGQHIGPLGRVAFDDCPSLDLVVKYEGETTTEEIVNRRKENKKNNGIPGIIYRSGKKLVENNEYPKFVDLDDLPPLDYQMYPDYLKFTPYIEESRGCCFNCRFCTSNWCNKGKIRIKSAKRFLEEFDLLYKLYGKDKEYAILASTFGFNIPNTLEIAKGFKKYGIKWSTEFRVDLKWEAYLYELYESGMNVLNVGMESASPQILKYMNKTKNPENYIKKTEDLINACSKLKDLSLRINFMFYLGETPKTVGETIGFLSRNKKGIDSILYSLILYTPEIPLAKELPYFKEKYGSDIYKADYWNKVHIYPCKPSRYFSTEEASYFCSAMEKIFSTEEGWYQSEMTHYSQESQEEVNKVKEALISSRFKGVE